ncbi:MAG: gliding motility-associated C-terminal domain-containing protein, partial [Ferruginibacter sp.]
GVGVINTSNGLAQLCMNITHPNDDELEIVLIAPDGTTVPLTVQNGGSGNNYTGTCFSATATTSIKAGTAPFTGTFIPEGYLGAVNNGQNANGAWSLCIQDRRTAANAGSLVNWSITFSNTPAPLPPALPGCSTTLPGTSSCSNATNVCDFNGLCGNTSGTTVQDWAGSGLNACFGLENNSFVKFIASSTSASFSVWVPTTTTGGYNTAGIQMLFFSGTCNSGAVTTYGCYPHIYPYPSPGNPLVTIVNGTGFTPGNTYYLMIDGFNGDKCDYTIAAASGVNILNISPAAPTICAGGSVNLTASGGTGPYTWAPPGGLNTTNGPNVTASPSGTTIYTVTSTTFGSCPITKDVTVTVNPLPAAPVLNVVNNCGSSTITATGVTGTLTWSDAGTGNPRTGTTAGTYTVTQTVGGCTSPLSNSVTTAPLPVPAAPVLTVVNNCGSSVITATGVTGTLTWSDAGTGNPRTVTTAGTYTVTQTVGGCTSPVSNAVTTAPLPVPAAPVLTVVNNCGSSVITATGVTGTLTWSDAGTGNPRTVTTAGTYTVTQTTGGCTSTNSNAVITAPLPMPAAPVLTVVNNCGSSVITATGVTGTLTWSDAGTGNPRTVTTPGVYSVTQTAGGCTSLNSNAVTAAPLSIPATPTATVLIQPGCTIPTGTVLITAPIGANLEYSINGINYQELPTFINVAPGSYAVTVRNTTTNCISNAGSVIVNPVPAGPAAPAVLATQPDCNTATGTIVVSSPTGPNLEYSIDGTNYQASATFNAVAPGPYTVLVKNTLTSCVSPASIVNINAAPLTPAAATASVVGQPNCSVKTGTIMITAPVGSTVEYSLNSGPFQSNTIYSGLTPGNYTITVRYTGSPCISAPTNLTVVPVDINLCQLDIYFPSAFTPNGDGNNDEFGPGPLSNLSGITAYTLHIYNRYGQLVFYTHDPYKKWDGKFKGRLSGNMNFVWQASYTRSNGAKEFQKGSVSIVK